MKLSKLLFGITNNHTFKTEPDIKGISSDSRTVKNGYLFVALFGHHSDGKLFAAKAVANGAVAILSEEPISVGVPCIVTKDIKTVTAALSRKLYGYPDSKMIMFGITGTNGKTTITYFIEHILKKAGIKPGILGTINYRYGSTIVDAPNTTPEAAQLFKVLGEMANNKCEAAVLEVSSHALELKRVEGIEFDVAVFTNLTRDHLDFHKSMEAYFASKSKLFTSLCANLKQNKKFAIINADDEWGKKLFEITKPCAKVFSYGLGKKCDFRAEDIKVTREFTQFNMLTPFGSSKIHLHHLGLHNIYNALASAGACLSRGIDFETVVEALESVPLVPGRLQKVDAGQPFTVVVDYAHTDDALKNVLESVVKLKPKRIITVFGCGGDRDRTKRPIMGEIATRMSDFVFVTSDNPRSEDPQQITLDIEVGIRRKQRNNYEVILDREQAIASAVSIAQKDDILLIAGKGHENYQILGDRKIHFNDIEVAQKYIQERFKT